MWSGGQEQESKTVPSSHSPTTTHVVSRPGTAEPRQALVQNARSQGSPGLVRRALFKFLGSAENLVRGQADEAGSDLSRHAESPRSEVVEQPSDKRRLSLALQGGGVFGAFNWGVLDRLLEDDLELDAVSGASAGAINAVLLASGLAKGGPNEARQPRAVLERRGRECH